jgi:hypothetical protein
MVLIFISLVATDVEHLSWTFIYIFEINPGMGWGGIEENDGGDEFNYDVL